MRMCACRGTAGFVHVSCLAEQAKTLVAEAEENNLVDKLAERWARWHTCRLCEQGYHGVVACALGWACWKTYVGRPETYGIRRTAMSMLGNGLANAGHHEDELSVREAELAIERRLDAPEEHILVVQGNLAVTYYKLGHIEKALSIERDVYSGRLKLSGEEHEETLLAACNYAAGLDRLRRFEEAKSLLRKVMPVARRILGSGHDHTLRMRTIYASALYKDAGATLDDLREAVATLEETTQAARRVLGGAHPLVVLIEGELHNARASSAGARVVRSKQETTN